MANTYLMKAEIGWQKMCKKAYILGILAASTLGVLPFAGQASANPCCQPRGGDNAVVQTSTQQANVTGKGNAVNQNSNQLVNTASNTSTSVRPTRTTSTRTTPRRTAQVRTRRPVHRPAPAAAPCKTIEKGMGIRV